MKAALEGSQAIARAIKMCRPGIVCAYPITPQTHIVENLSQYKADGEGDYEYVLADSELAAASIVEGASAAGIRSYTASASQGLLLMTEVLFNIAGMRLPVVLTCANRSVGAPLNIWNDHQDAMTVRDAGWIMLFASDNQEAIEMHIEAFKIAEQLQIPVMVNIDGFLLTHTLERVDMPSQNYVNSFLPVYKPKKGTYLDVKDPKIFGCYATPHYYIKIREELQNDMLKSKTAIRRIFSEYKKMFKKGNSRLTEYYGPKNPKTIIIAMGSVINNIRHTLNEENSKDVGVLKIKVFRPFPKEEILNTLKGIKNIIVLDKAVSLGSDSPLAAEIKSICYSQIKAKINGFVIGLGGRDITPDIIKQVINEAKKMESGFSRFVY